jgi:hypothetical protein
MSATSYGVEKKRRGSGGTRGRAGKPVERGGGRGSGGERNAGGGAQVRALGE